MLTSRVLQDALDLMSKIENLSSPSQLLRATSWLQLVDLEAASAATGVESASLLERSKTRYLCAHDWLLSQLEHMGEKIERRFENLTFKIASHVTKACFHFRYDGASEFSTPVAPLDNLYLPQLLPLVQTKLRVGHAMARLAASPNKDVYATLSLRKHS